MKKLFTVGLVTLFQAVAYSQSVTLNIDAELLKTSGGSPMPMSGLLILVTSTLDSIFGGPTATSFVTGDDAIVHKWDLSAAGGGGGFGNGIFQGTTGPIPLSSVPNWTVGDPFQLYWFPTLTLNSSAPGAGTSYGEYRDATGADGFIWDTPSSGATIALRFFTSDTILNTGGPNPASAGNASAQSPLISGRYVFYNRSAFDGNNASANASDDGAIATDKTALLPGGTATFANYTSYSRGINGVMVDIVSLPGTPTASDFSFKVGNDNTPGGWGAAPAPASISVRFGAGVSGSDRVTLIWADNAIQTEWLQITVKATAVTGLAVDDVFYFGNAIGEAGNSATDARVNATDEILARNNQRASGQAPIDFAYDYNRDNKVNATDQIIARLNQTSSVTALQLITVP